MSCNRYAKANNKYMKNYGKNIASSYLMYLDANNLYGWAMSQKLPANDFEWEENIHKFDEHFIKDYYENSNKVYFLEVDVEYPKHLFSGIAFKLHSALALLPERNEIKKRSKLVCNVHDKENYVVHIRALKQALNHGLIFTKVHRVIEFNQEAWLKP